jgi:aromatic-L-amino-acid decarboxylase
MEKKSYHMTAGEFRQHAHEVVDWVANYIEQIEGLAVLSSVKPGQIYEDLPSEPPSQPQPLSEAFEVLEKTLLPGITHWQHPSFFAYFPANASFPAILGELLSAGLGVQGMLWSTSPAATELETRVLDWLVEMLGLPSAFCSRREGGGVIQDSASSATLCALLAARERALADPAARAVEQGRMRLFASEHAHSSLDKAARIAGLGVDSIVRVATDERYAMRPDVLEDELSAARQRGELPLFVFSTVGSTSSNAMDPLRAVGEAIDAACEASQRPWFHVDAAMSGTAALCPEFRHLQDGVELADSYCFNPHKWMFTNFDCDCFFVRDRRALISALSIAPEYLKNAASESGEVFDYRDWQIPLGRRFRALKLWLVIRHYGIEGLQHHIREHVALAQQFAARVVEHEDFELAAEVPLNLVCLRHRAGEAVTRRIAERINASGEAFVTHTRLDGQYTLRVSIGGIWTEQRHVEKLWALIQHSAKGV